MGDKVLPGFCPELGSCVLGAVLWEAGAREAAEGAGGGGGRDGSLPWAYAGLVPPLPHLPDLNKASASPVVFALCVHKART